MSRFLGIQEQRYEVRSCGQHDIPAMPTVAEAFHANASASSSSSRVVHDSVEGTVRFVSSNPIADLVEPMPDGDKVSTSPATRITLEPTIANRTSESLSLHN